MKAIVTSRFKPLLCLKCHGSVLKDGEELVCINCGSVITDNFLAKFQFDPKLNRFTEKNPKEALDESTP